MRKVISENGLVFTITKQGAFCNNTPMEYIDEGEEGIVYRYQDKAIKIYHEQPRKRVISSSLLEKLKTIDTNRINLPIEILSAEESKKDEGYITQFLEGNKEDIYFYEKQKLLEELMYLDSDFKRLGKESIVIGDLRLSNYISNKIGLYLLDFGDYYKSSMKTDTTNMNKKEFQTFFLYNLVGTRLTEEGQKQNLPDQIITSVYRKERYELTHHKDGLIDYLEKNMQEEENLNHYVKRLIRTKNYKN